MVRAVGLLPLERFRYQSGKTEGGREFPVFKMVEDLGDNFHWEIWSRLMTMVGTEGFWRGGRRRIYDGRRARAGFTWY